MAHKALRKAHQATLRPRKAWAIVKDGKIVIDDNAPVRALLLFDKKWRADAAVWKSEEEHVIRVTITPMLTR